MVEDALKSSRTIHRLILAVNAATLIFAFSLQRPPEMMERLEQLRAYKQVDHLAYETFVQDKAKKYAAADTQAYAQKIQTGVDEAGGLVFGKDKIAEAFRSPPHMGRVIVDDSVLAEGDSALIGGLDLMGRLYITSRSPQVLVPNDPSVIEAIQKFLLDEAEAGMRVNKMTFGVDGVDFMVESFLDADMVLAQFSFELVPAQGAARVFTAAVECKVREVPDASLKEWLLDQPGSDAIYESVGDGVIVFPKLRPFAEGLTEQTVGAAINEAQNEIRRSSPDSQNISLLGTEIPGRLVLVAAPLISTLLLVYLAGHLRHLARLVDTHRAEFEQFAWMPLGPRWGRIEAATTLVAVPAASQLLLVTRLWGFGTSRVLIVLVPLVLLPIGVGAALLCLSRLKALRRSLSS